MVYKYRTTSLTSAGSSSACNLYVGSSKQALRDYVAGACKISCALMQTWLSPRLSNNVPRIAAVYQKDGILSGHRPSACQIPAQALRCQSEVRLREDLLPGKANFH